MFDEKYCFVSFNIEFVLHNGKLGTTKIKERTTKKCLKSCSTKSTFTVNDVIYEQIGGRSVGSCLRVVLVNINTTELEISIFDNLFKVNLLIICYVNSSDPSFEFRIGKFEDGFIKYYGIKVVSYETPI